MTTYAYDLAGNLLSETDPLGHTTTYTYNECNEQTSQTDSDGGVTRYTYDPDGDTLSLTDPDGNETDWTYDFLDRVSTETEAAGAVAQATSYDYYDLAGDLTSDGRLRRPLIVYQYDHLGRESKEFWYADVTDANDQQNCEHEIQYGYDGEDNLTSASDIDPQTDANLSPSYSMSYDGSGNMLSQTISNLPGLSGLDVTLGQTFDYDNNRLTLRTTVGGTFDLENIYSYNSLGELAQVEQTNQFGGDSVTPERADFAYDADGRLSTIDRYADTAGTEPVACSQYTYDDNSNLTGLVDTGASDNTLADYVWTYDAAGRITDQYSLADSGGGAKPANYTTWANAAYTYDNDSQLLTASYSNYQTTPVNLTPPACAETYDANGNRTGGSQTTSDNRVTFDGTYYYQYDAEGNRIARWVDNNRRLESPLRSRATRV